MEELWSFGSVIALWIVASCVLWWVHRRRVYGHQKRQLEQAARAIALIRDAQDIFDQIRTPVPLENPPQDTGEWLRAETHGLLRRIQDHGDFFDKVNTLRVQLQASAGIEDHTPLSEILNLRRDLWAASEILLVEDPKSFGATFSEDGAYERFHAEALQLLFKSARRTGDDLIDLRLSLAANDAESFATELGQTIEAAREKDRLPTFSEAIAYPLAFFRAIPRELATAYNFGRAFFGHAADTARAMRESETMARGASRLRQAQEDWPQRLSAGFERASTAARGSATALQRHYDFLVTAYDFQTKYEEVVRRAPDITERGRQFIARLELAERSERLRLTSANAAIWTARRSLDGLAHLIAGLQRTQTALRETTLWRLAGRLLAPAPLTGRRKSPFRSYRRALAIAGLSETAPEIGMRLPAAEMRAEQAAAMKAGRAGKGAVSAKTAGKPKAAAKAIEPASKSGRRAAKSAPASPARNKAVTTPPPRQQKPSRPIFGGILAGLTRSRTEKPIATKHAIEAETPSRKVTAKTVPTPTVQSPDPQPDTPPKAAAKAKSTPAVSAKATAKPSRTLFSWRKQGSEKTPAPVFATKAKTTAPAAETKPTSPTPDKTAVKPSRGLFSWRKSKGEQKTDKGSVAVVAKAKTPTAEVEAPVLAKPTPAAPEKATPKASRRLFSWRQPKVETAPEIVTAAVASAVEAPQPETVAETPPKLDRAARRKQKRAKTKSADVAMKPEPSVGEPQAAPSANPMAAKKDTLPSPASKPTEADVPEKMPEPPAKPLPDVPASAVPAPESAPPKRRQLETPESPEATSPIAAQTPNGTRAAATAIAFEPEDVAEEAAPERRPSFFRRLFMREPKPADTGIDEQIIERLAAAYAEQSEAAPDTDSEETTPVTVAPRLMEKLSSLSGDEVTPDAADEESVEDDLDDVEDVIAVEDAREDNTLADDGTDEPDLTEPGPLTLSILELQSKMKPKTPQIRSFPWLRE